MSVLQIVVVLVVLASAAAFQSSGARRVQASTVSTRLHMGLKEWFMPIVKPDSEMMTPDEIDAELAKFPQDQLDRYDDRFFASVTDFKSQEFAKSQKEFDESPAFPTDRNQALRRPVKWPGNRPPLPNFERMDQGMDATWGRGKYRKEIWTDVVNPVVDWKTAYEPSHEEIDAMFGGPNKETHPPFWYNDPEGWCGMRGLDFDKTMEEYEVLKANGYAEYKAQEKKKAELVTQREYEEYKVLKERIEKQAFRVEDNLNQLFKGSPSIDNEDTGSQWKND